MQLIGKTLDKYRIIEQIGQGGMATVYKAYQANLDRFVAIKILAPQHAQSPGFRERFFREAKSIAQLSHANILPIHDVGIEDDLCFIVMKFVAGASMSDIMGERIPLPRICTYIDQIAGALDHAHENGIVHRDIKPANFLLDKEWVFLTDFGIAKIMEGSTVLTTAGEIMGTPAYMSPEQAMGKPTDYRTDIYSLGIVLYQMVTGEVPFKGETPYGVMFRHVNDPLPLPRTVAPDLPEPVEHVILKALAKAPEHRYESAGKLAEALRMAASTEREELKTRIFSSPVIEQPAAEPPPEREANPISISRELSDPDANSAVAIETAPRQKRPFLPVLALVGLLAVGIAVFLLTKSTAPPPAVPTKPESEVINRPVPIKPPAEPAALLPGSETEGASQETAPKPPSPTSPEEDAATLYQKAMHSLDQRNYKDALQYFQRAGENGHAMGFHEIGYMYRQGLGVTRNDAEAAIWYRKAADQGIAASQSNLGVMYLKGEGVEKNEKEAFKWFMKAAGQGNPSAQFYIATMYRNGISVPADEERALEWYKKAADLGHLQAGEIYEKARADKSAEDAGALHAKAMQYVEQKNYAEALRYFQRAGEQGKAESLNELGYMYRRGLGVKKNDFEAAKWYRKAADQGSAPAWNNLGVMYLKGEGVEKSEKEAFKCFERAAGQGNAGAQFHLAIMYQKGIGTSLDKDKALEWYGKAAEQGHEQAKAALKTLGRSRN